MNYYFLLEDQKSFIKVLPEWLKHMGFICKRVQDIAAVKDNTYILQSGQGVTQLITKVLFQTINTIILSPQRIDKLVVILDAEEEEVEDRRNQVFEKIKEDYDISSLDFEIIVLVCNHCFESWLLGCQWAYPKNEVEEDSFFYQYHNHYNVSKCDPELMTAPLNSNETTAQYHFHYLHEMFRYSKRRYKKSKPDLVSKDEYFKGLLERIDTTEHIASFKEFVEFITNEISYIN